MIFLDYLRINCAATRLNYCANNNNNVIIQFILGLLDDQTKPIKAKRNIPASVIYQIQLLIHSGDGSGDQIQPAQQNQQFAYYNYHLDENASPALSYESSEPASESPTFPSDTDLHYAQETDSSFDSQPHSEPISPATQQFLHEIEFSDSGNSSEIYFDAQSTDLSVSSEANFDPIQIDLDLFSESESTSELIGGSFM